MLDLNDISEEQAVYIASNVLTDERIYEIARQKAHEKLKKGNAITSVDSAKNEIKQIVRDFNREHFVVLFLDNKNSVIKHENIETLTVCSCETLFSGTINQARIYPREIARRALELSSNAILLAHNHPSGNSEPSRVDIDITNQIQEAMKLFDIRLLDHLVVTEDEITSFAERGLL